MKREPVPSRLRKPTAVPNRLIKSSGRRRRGSPVDRRTFLGHLGVGAGAVAGLTASASTLLAQSAKDPQGVEGIVRIRQARAFEVRMRAAELARKRRQVEQTANGDEALYPNRIGNYSKGFPHNNLGEVDPAAYNAFLAALGPLTRGLRKPPHGSRRKLTNPLAGMAFDLEGPDSHHLAQAPAPRIASAEAAADLGRTTGWRSAGTSTSTTMERARSSPLQRPTSALLGLPGTPERLLHHSRNDLPRVDGGRPRRSVYFAVSLAGHSMGALRISQLIWTLLPGQDYLTSYGDWLASQNASRTTATRSTPPRTTSAICAIWASGSTSMRCIRRTTRPA